MVVPKWGRGPAPFFWGGAEKGGLCTTKSGHITTAMTLKESVRPVDYGGMGRGHQPPPQSPTQGPLGLCGLRLSPCYSPQGCEVPRGVPLLRADRGNFLQ